MVGDFLRKLHAKCSLKIVVFLYPVAIKFNSPIAELSLYITEFSSVIFSVCIVATASQLDHLAICMKFVAFTFNSLQ